MFTVGFSRPKGDLSVFSIAIRLIEKRNYSHAYIKYTDLESGIELVSQASHGSLNLVEYNIFKENNIIVEEYIVPSTIPQFQSIISFIHKNLGRPYSFTQVLLIFIKKITGIEFKYVNNAYICSEWALRLLEIAGLSSESSEEYVTPSDLNQLVKSKFKSIQNS